MGFTLPCYLEKLGADFVQSNASAFDEMSGVECCWPTRIHVFDASGWSTIPEQG